MDKKLFLLAITIIIASTTFAADNPKRITLLTDYSSVVAAINDIAGHILPDAGIFPETIDKEYGRIKTEPVELSKLNGTAVYIIRAYLNPDRKVAIDISGTWTIVGYNEKAPSSFEKRERAQKGSIAAKTWNNIERIAEIIPHTGKTYR